MKAKKHTLLIVEDDEAQCFVLARIFKRLETRYRIRFAGGGDEAIAYLKGEGKYADRKEYEFPSYLITDLKMADGDGFHVLEFIQSNPAMSVIPIVMLSASDDADDIRQAYRLGASSYFVKPTTLTELEALLKMIHQYWAGCEVPEVDPAGYALETDSKGKLGERYTKQAG